MQSLRQRRSPRLKETCCNGPYEYDGLQILMTFPNGEFREWLAKHTAFLDLPDFTRLFTVYEYI